MMIRHIALIFSLLGTVGAIGQDNLQHFLMSDSVLVTIDKPARIHSNIPVVILFYALPNGNSTAQTRGKKLQEGDDWHYDIQHIGAQTAFLRRHWKKHQLVVIYLENNLRAWPAWKQRHNYPVVIPHIIDSLVSLFPGEKRSVYLNGHSGGGSFVLGFIASQPEIPAWVKSISFLDSNYGYDSTYLPKFRDWLLKNEEAALNVFAYNDSVALYNGKPVVSATGGTWYRSHRQLNDLRSVFTFRQTRNDSLIEYEAKERNIHFFLKTNPDRKILHTVQVERNGFIHSVLSGTKYDSRRYRYYGKRAYSSFIPDH